MHPHRGDTAPESALAGYLAEGEALMLATEPASDGDDPVGVSEAFEHLRWFDLPGCCLDA